MATIPFSRPPPPIRNFVTLRAFSRTVLLFSFARRIEPVEIPLLAPGWSRAMLGELQVPPESTVDSTGTVAGGLIRHQIIERFVIGW
jgi:hypothetical protein